MANLTLSGIKRPTIITLIFIVVVIAVLIIVILRGLSKPQEEPAQPSPSVIPYTGAKLPQASGFTDQLAKIRSILPYKGENFLIEYLPSANLINVKIEAKSKEEFLQTKQQVKDLLKSRDVNDFCALNIFWIAPKDPQVRKSIDPKEFTNPECL